MIRARLAFLIIFVGFEGCVHGQPRNAKCELPAAPHVDQSADNQRHLSRDALKAEDVAIRFADSHNAPHSGHFEGFSAYTLTMDSCKTALLAVVAHNHGVPLQQVRKSLGRRPLGLDLSVMLSFGALYGLVAYRIAGRVRRNFPPEGGSDTVAAVVATVFTALFVSGPAVLIGEWYALAAEMTWVGNGHLSYRTDRIPWNHHRLELFLVGVFLFLVIAAFRYRIEPNKRSRHATAIFDG